MNWLIYKGKKHINTIYGGEDFVKSYCEANGYTYEKRDDGPEPEPIKPQPTTEERLAAMESAMLAMMMGG